MATDQPSCIISQRDWLARDEDVKALVAEAETRGYARAVEGTTPGCMGCHLRSDGLLCDEHRQMLLNAEARGYERGRAGDPAGDAALVREAEAAGFARGIELAAKLCEERARGWSVLRSLKMTYWAEAAEVLAAEIRTRPKPKAVA